jgi:hypothetical protein
MALLVLGVGVDVIDGVIVAEFSEVVLVPSWARATEVGINDERRAKSATVMRTHMPNLLPNPATFMPN